MSWLVWTVFTKNKGKHTVRCILAHEVCFQCTENSTRCCTNFVHSLSASFFRRQWPQKKFRISLQYYIDYVSTGNHTFGDFKYLSLMSICANINVLNRQNETILPVRPSFLAHSCHLIKLHICICFHQFFAFSLHVLTVPLTYFVPFWMDKQIPSFISLTVFCFKLIKCWRIFGGIFAWFL